MAQTTILILGLLATAFANFGVPSHPGCDKFFSSDGFYYSEKIDNVTSAEICQFNCRSTYDAKCQFFIFVKFEQSCYIIDTPFEDYVQNIQVGGGPPSDRYGTRADCKAANDPCADVLGYGCDPGFPWDEEYKNNMADCDQFCNQEPNCKLYFLDPEHICRTYIGWNPNLHSCLGLLADKNADVRACSISPIGTPQIH